MITSHRQRYKIFVNRISKVKMNANICILRHDISLSRSIPDLNSFHRAERNSRTLGQRGELWKFRATLTSSWKVRNTNFQSVFNFSTILRDCTQRMLSWRREEWWVAQREWRWWSLRGECRRDFAPYKTCKDANVVFFSPSRSCRLPLGRGQS